MLSHDTAILSLRYDQVAWNPMGWDISMHMDSACNRYACGNVVSRTRLASRPKPTLRPYPDVSVRPPGFGPFTMFRVAPRGRRETEGRRHAFRLRNAVEFRFGKA